MMSAHDGAVDHVGRSFSPGDLGQALQHGVEHPALDPAAIAAKDAVPFTVFVGKLTPLRPGSRDPQHPLEIGPVVTRRATASPALGRQQRPDQRPILVRNTDPLTQCRLQKAALNQLRVTSLTFVHVA